MFWPLALTRPILAASGLNVSRSKATSLPLGEIDASMSTAPFFGRVTWRRWLPSGLAETMYCLENDLVFRDQTMVEPRLAAGDARTANASKPRRNQTPWSWECWCAWHSVPFCCGHRRFREPGFTPDLPTLFRGHPNGNRSHRDRADALEAAGLSER